MFNSNSNSKKRPIGSSSSSNHLTPNNANNVNQFMNQFHLLNQHTLKASLGASASGATSMQPAKSLHMHQNFPASYQMNDVYNSESDDDDDDDGKTWIDHHLLSTWQSISIYSFVPFSFILINN